MDLEFNNIDELEDLILMNLKNPQNASSLIDLLNKSKHAEKIGDKVISDEEGWVLFRVNNVFGSQASSVNISIGYFKNFIKDLVLTIYVADRWYQNSRKPKCIFFKGLFLTSFLQKGMHPEPDDSFSDELKKFIPYLQKEDKEEGTASLYGFGSQLMIKIDDDSKKKIASCRVIACPKMFAYGEKTTSLQEPSTHENSSMKDTIEPKADNSLKDNENFSMMPLELLRVFELDKEGLDFRSLVFFSEDDNNFFALAYDVAYVFKQVIDTTGGGLLELRQIIEMSIFGKKYPNLPETKIFKVQLALAVQQILFYATEIEDIFTLFGNTKETPLKEDNLKKVKVIYYEIIKKLVEDNK